MPDFKVILISGAGTGIGRACAVEFARAGYAVAGFGRRAEPLESLESEIAAAGGRALVAVADVCDDAAVLGFAGGAAAKLGGIDVLFANAGIAITGYLADSTTDELREQIEVNLIGAFNTIKAALPHLIERRGRIFVNTSMASRKVYSEWGHYSAAKAGLAHMARIWREELKAAGVRVTEVAVGATDTPLWDEIRPGKDRSYMIDPDSIARLMLEVASQSEQVSTEEILMLPAQ